MPDTKARSRLQETLLHLYLRLNGFFVTGFIVHSPDHGEWDEIDAMAIRMRHHCEPDKVITPSAFLDWEQGCIDLLICEVKSGGQPLKFNEALLRASRTLGDPYSLVWTVPGG